MANSVNDQYLEARVMSASPVELVRMLYEAATQSVREARSHLAAGDIAARSREISRAAAVLIELHSSLDPDKGGDLALRLGTLYDYMERRLLEANQQQADAPLAEVLDLLTTLAQGWSAVPAEPETRPVEAPVAELPAADYGAGSGYGSFTPAMAYAGGASQSWSG